MNQITSIILLLFISLSFSCEKADNPPGTFALGEPFELSAKHPSADCECGQMSITYTSVEEDSRCPAMTTCVWEGRAVVEFDLTMDNNQQKLVLVSRAGHEELSRDTINDFIFSLESVNPYPENSDVIAEEDYRFELEVTAL